MRTTKLTALPGAENKHKHTDYMPKKKTSKTPSAPAVDRAAPCSGLERLHLLEALPEDIALIRAQNPLQRELHDGRPVVGWPKWAKDNLRSVIRYRVAITGGDVSAWEP